MSGIKKIYRTIASDPWLWVLLVGSFIGIWHALPLTNVINDEMYFVGGVLRAIQAKSVIPLLGDAPYGLLTFWLNYILFVVLLCILFVIFGFRGSVLTSFLVKQASWLYLVPRFLNALIAGVSLFIFKDIFQRVGIEKRTQILLVFALFTNLITTAVLHTGKMWVLSVTLVILSIRFLYLTVREKGDAEAQSRNIFFSILFAFLAFANFPLCGFALIAIPILFAFHRSDTRLVWAIGKSTLIGAALFVALFLMNAGNIINQVTDIFTVYHPIGAAAAVRSGIGFGPSFVMHATQVLILFPLLLCLIGIGVFRGVKDRPLLYIASSYATVYFIMICVLVTWSSDLSANLRYLFPLGSFFVLMAASLSLPVGRWMTALCGLFCIPYLFFLYLISVPTTYNQAVSWAVSDPALHGAVIINQIGPRLDVPKDARSYRLTQEKFCGSKCQEALRSPDASSVPFLVIDAESTSTLPVFGGDLYRFTTSTVPLPGETLVRTFSDGGPDHTGFEIDYAVGNYFDPSFYLIKRFGEQVSVFRQAAHKTGAGPSP